MNAFLAGVLIGAVLAALVVAPFVAPWRARVGLLLLAAHVPDPLSGMVPWPRLAMSEVCIAGVRRVGDGIEIAVVESARPRRRSLVAASHEVGLFARLEGWSAVRESLLLIVDDDGHAQLCGPDGDVAGLRAAHEWVS